ncbi:hypothetical protein MSAN_02395900 [Mycena sanguinolenta]|uniref:Uncharacterized protein n=1 Tax=Mycena sanguinolenta TaxID=230812 RepID=A0A8H7CE68_9AGAR|nr:hypothetical protein MSAN_02395900 [Mycena sanguinolenta]
MIHTSYGRSLLSAVLCICYAQTFVDGSARELQFAPAFAAALDAYVGSTTEAAVVAEIHKLMDSPAPTDPSLPASPPLPEHKHTSTWFPQPAWLKKRDEKKRKEREKREREERKERAERAQQSLIDIIKGYRLRFHEERKAQMERTDPL